MLSCLAEFSQVLILLVLEIKFFFLNNIRHFLMDMALAPLALFDNNIKIQNVLQIKIFN